MATPVEPMFAGTTLSRDLFSLVRGDRLGDGAAREVFECMLNSTYVMKFEGGSRSFQNVAEWEMWSWVRDIPAMARWFAPCRLISACGAILVQDRCEPLQARQRPRKLPAFLCDIKRENFGLLNGKVVCFDYGTGLSAIRRTSRKLIKVEWRS